MHRRRFECGASGAASSDPIYLMEVNMERNKKTSILKAAITAALACLLFAALAPAALALTSYVEGVYVYDDADVIPAAIEDDVSERAKALAAMTGVRVVIVSVASTEGKDSFTFARELFFDWGLGENDSRAVLFALSTEDRSYWTMQSASIKDTFTDADIRQINDRAIEPEFAAGNFAESVKAGFDAIVAKLEELYSVDLSKYGEESAVETQNADAGEKSSGFSIGKFFKVLLIIVLIAAGIIVALTVFAFLRRPRYVGSAENKRRHYRTDRGAYVATPEKSDLDRARAQNARAAQGQRPQGQYQQRQYPQGQYPQGQYPQGQYPQGQYPQGQYPQGQYPQGQYPQGQYPQGQYPQGQYPQGQYPQGQYPQGQYPQGQYPQGQYPQGQYPQGQYPQGQRQQNQRPQKKHEHPTVYPDRAPYVDQSNASRGYQSGVSGYGDGYDDGYFDNQ